VASDQLSKLRFVVRRTKRPPGHDRVGTPLADLQHVDVAMLHGFRVHRPLVDSVTQRGVDVDGVVRELQLHGSSSGGNRPLRYPDRYLPHEKEVQGEVEDCDPQEHSPHGRRSFWRGQDDDSDQAEYCDHAHLQSNLRALQKLPSQYGDQFIRSQRVLDRDCRRRLLDRVHAPKIARRQGVERVPAADPGDRSGGLLVQIQPHVVFDEGRCWGSSANPGSVGTFPWSTFWAALGSITAAAALLGGAAVAVYFGRKATVSITGDAHSYARQVTLSARPSITAIGYFKFVPLNASVSVVELLRPLNGELTQADEEWAVDGVFGNQFANGGETLSATTPFNVGPPGDEVVGWLVRIDVIRDTKMGRFALSRPTDKAMSRWLRRRFVRRWHDRNFVARPEVTSPHEHH
jgi:hypothetical protein